MPNDFRYSVPERLAHANIGHSQWAVAESLIYVGTAMQTGAETGNPLQRWNPIVHRVRSPVGALLQATTLIIDRT